MRDPKSSDIIGARIRVLYADTDKMGQAYYGNFMKWFEAGRSEWFRAHGRSYRKLEEEGYFLPVIEAYCRYYRPVFYDDVIVIQTRLSSPTPARFRFDYSIYRDGNADEVLAEGYTVHVCVNAERRPVKPPSFLKELATGVHKEE
ncbi:acyl-CoA thioesterase [Thermodesulforhabdus norvegica]|uniref:Acyl-CoA thioester hydrolase n=1 Tax=Thermodesulforhabdus norvegica TaxID=39841 RepID=A0A1I4SKN9_9BACT|nr:thioesterase family protein [Thermodesulforhabdus norvegica]SFM64999.1 acyl-CoA thioester hydrolase [Thermodesulforhabdus norvegica]